MNWFSCFELQERSLSNVKHICVWMIYTEHAGIHFVLETGDGEQDWMQFDRAPGVAECKSSDELVKTEPIAGANK